jgi:hypothetical protein
VIDRLPPGAAAVLINRSHTYRDLFLPIGTAEKQLFDAIDGELTIGDVIARTPSLSNAAGSLEAARAFFERLWLHDQVVFDAS